MWRPWSAAAFEVDGQVLADPLQLEHCSVPQVSDAIVFSV